MRTIKELLQTMLDNQDFFSIGLCAWASDLYYFNLITYEERIVLRSYIRDNRPSKYSSINAFIHKDSDFYWFEGDISPRIKWIKKHIKLNSHQ